MLLLRRCPRSAAPAGELLESSATAIRAHDPGGASRCAGAIAGAAGLYLTSIDGVSGYVSADGRYFIVGDMLDLASRTM